MIFLKKVGTFFKNLFSKKTEEPVLAQKPVEPLPPSQKIETGVVKDKENLTPWMDWMRSKLHWDEFSKNKELSVYWKYTNVPFFKSVIGSDHAWCAMIVCAALEETGFQSTRDAGAISFDSYGKKLDHLVKGCVVTISRTGGSGRHVTFFDHFAENGDMVCLGGNQNNEINLTSYPVSRLKAIRWPVPKKV